MTDLHFYDDIDNTYKTNISRLFAKTPYAKYLVVGNEEKEKTPKVSISSYNSSITTTQPNTSITTNPISLSDIIIGSPSSSPDSTSSTISSTISSSSSFLSNKRLLLHIKDIKQDFDKVFENIKSSISEETIPDIKELKFKTLLLSCMENTAIKFVPPTTTTNTTPLSSFIESLSSIDTNKSISDSVRTSISSISESLGSTQLSLEDFENYKKYSTKKYELPLCSVLLSMYDELENQNINPPYNFLNLALSDNHTEIVRTLIEESRRSIEEESKGEPIPLTEEEEKKEEGKQSETKEESYKKSKSISPFISNDIHYLKIKPDNRDVTPLHVICGLISDIDILSDITSTSPPISPPTSPPSSSPPSSSPPSSSDTSIININDISIIFESITEVNVDDISISFMSQDEDGITPLHLLSNKISSLREPLPIENKPNLFTKIITTLEKAKNGFQRFCETAKSNMLCMVDRFGNTPLHNLFMGIVPSSELPSHIKELCKSISPPGDKDFDNSFLGLMLEIPNMEGKKPLSFINADAFFDIFEDPIKSDYETNKTSGKYDKYLKNEESLFDSSVSPESIGASINDILLEFSDSDISIDMSYRSLFDAILHIDPPPPPFDKIKSYDETISDTTIIRHLSDIFISISHDDIQIQRQIRDFLRINKKSKVATMIEQYLYDKCAYELVFDLFATPDTLSGYINLKESDFLIDIDDKNIEATKSNRRIFHDNYKTDPSINLFIENIREHINKEEEYYFSIKYHESEYRLSDNMSNK